MAETEFYGGESTIYVGKLYLIEISLQIRNIRLSQRNALTEFGESILAWLTELRCFYDLIENQLSLINSEKEIDFKDYKFESNKIKEVEIKIQEQYKFLRWFDKIEAMYLRVTMINENEGSKVAIFKKSKEVLTELSTCYRELMYEANKKHLIMPDVKVDMKALAKGEWVDREAKQKLN